MHATLHATHTHTHCHTLSAAAHNHGTAAASGGFILCPAPTHICGAAVNGKRHTFTRNTAVSHCTAPVRFGPEGTKPSAAPHAGGRCITLRRSAGDENGTNMCNTPLRFRKMQRRPQTRPVSRHAAADAHTPCWRLTHPPTVAHFPHTFNGKLRVFYIKIRQFNLKPLTDDAREQQNGGELHGQKWLEVLGTDTVLSKFHLLGLGKTADFFVRSSVSSRCAAHRPFH